MIRTNRALTPYHLGMLAVVSLVTLVALAFYLDRAPSAVLAPASAPLVEFRSETSNESEIRDRDITFYETRVSEDRQGAADRLTLASLLFTRARATGSMPDMARVEALARESIGLRSERNGQALELLASVLMARHDFREARAVAMTADSLEPRRPSHLALLGEIELELGEYAAAAAHFKAVPYDVTQFTVGARLARWYEVTGHASVARAMLNRASMAADQRDDLPREQVAWFHYRLGELELRLGKPDAADAAFQRALLRNPDDLRALGGLTRTALARGEYRRAIEYGDKAIGIQLDPTILGTVSQAHLALGDSAEAKRFASAMSVAVLTQPGAIHRAWGHFLLDHGSPADRAEVLRRARREIRERGDVYGHDLLAWALFRTGRLAEARREMALALSQRTEDVTLASHAAAIGVPAHAP